MMATIDINDARLLMAVLTLALLGYALWPGTLPKQICFGTGAASMLATVGLGIAFAATPPTPLPPPLPTPIPTPAVGGLADLVPAEYRGKIGRFYADLGYAVLVVPNIPTTDALRDGYIAAGQILKQQERLPAGLKPFADQASALLQQSLGLESKPLDDNTRKAFANTCQAIAVELGVTP